MPTLARSNNVFFYWADGGRRDDEGLHEPILDAGDHAAANAVSRKVAKKLGLSDADIVALFGDGGKSRGWDESKHPREPAGSPEGGQFAGGGESGSVEPSGVAQNPNVNMDAARRVIEQIAAGDLGYRGKQIIVSPETPSDGTSGEYDFETEQIRIYPKMMPQGSMPGTVAHEVMHAKQDNVFGEELPRLSVDAKKKLTDEAFNEKEMLTDYSKS